MIKQKIYYDWNSLNLNEPFINYIRLMVVAFISKINRFSKNNKIHFWDICFRYFYSTKKDKTLNIDQQFFDTIDEYYESYYNQYNCKRFSDETAFNAFLSFIHEEVEDCVNDLIWMLELSANNECPIIQDDFDFSSIINVQPYLQNDTPSAYSLLKIRCEEIIGPLPEIETFNDVLRIKSRNKTELKNLRNVLSEFEYTLRNFGSKKSNR